MKNRIHCTCALFAIIMSCTVGYRWYTLSINGASGDGRGWTGHPRNRRIRFRSHIFYEVPDVFFYEVPDSFLIRAWFKYICRNNLVWMPRKCSKSSRSPRCRRSQQKKQKLSGTSRMFRGASALEPQESEMMGLLSLTQSPMRFGGGQVFQKTNASGLSVSRMVYSTSLR